MHWLALTMILAASLCIAAPHCPDPRLRQATIGGDTITGGVVLHKKPLKFAQVRLYSSSGKTAWIGTTDEKGRFTTNEMPPDDYRLEVSGWGSTTVHLSPEVDKGFRQKPAYDLLLDNNACVAAVMIMN
jgi:Carboxypeptidase regulatory-like domain